MVTQNEGTTPIFESTRGQSHIDATAASQAILANVEASEVQKAKLTTTSDHKVITWTLVRGRSSRDEADTTGWCSDKANWNKFARKIKEQEHKLREELKRCDNRQ